MTLCALKQIFILEGFPKIPRYQFVQNTANYLLLVDKVGGPQKGVGVWRGGVVVVAAIGLCAAWCQKCAAWSQRCAAWSQKCAAWC